MPAYQITNREFTDYQGRTLTFPYFSGFDPIVAKYTFQGQFSVTFSTISGVMKDGDSLVLVSGSWEELGFFDGAGVSGTYGSETIAGGTTVEFVDGATMFLSGTLSGTDGTVYTSGTITCDDPPNALDVFFNLVPNQNGAQNEYSLIDGEANKFTVNLNSLAVGATATMTRAGNFSGGSIMSAEVERLADSGGKRVYEVSITFKVWTVKLPDQYLTTNCVKPWIKIRIMPEYNNPTVYTDLINSPADANTGWLNERGNGNIPDYTVGTIQWENMSGDPLPAMDHTQSTRFEVPIIGTFTSGSKLNIAWYFDSIEDVDYKNLPLPIDNNLMFVTSDTPLVIGTGNPDLTGAERADGAGLVLSDIEITQSGTSAIFSGTLTPNQEFTDFINSKGILNRNYILTIRVEDPSLTDNLVNPVWVIADRSVMQKEVIPLGSYPLNGQRVFAHNEESIENLPVFLEDDIRINTRFKLPKDIQYDSMTIGMTAYNTVTSKSFILESSEINLKAWPILVDGTTPINYQKPKNYNLSPANPHNVIEVIRRPSLDDSDEYGVEINYSTLIDWRYWVSLPNVPVDFFGQENKEWEHYQSGDWIVGFGMQIFTVDGAYENFFEIQIKDYDDFNGTSVIEYFRLDGTPLTKPLTNEQILVRCTHTPDVGIDPADPCWSQITVEPFEGSPRWDSSTVYANTDPNNPLGTSEQTLTSTTVVTECLYDPAKVTDPTKVSFTGRFLSDNKDPDTLPQNRTKRKDEAVRVPKSIQTEDRGSKTCCDCEFPVFASLTENETWKNCISSRWQIGEDVTFELKKDGVLTPFQPSAQQFANDTTAYYATITWKDVLTSSGTGCYRLYANYDVAGITGTVLLGIFNLTEFSWNRLNNNTRIRSVFNDANDFEQINFTNSFVVDDIVIRGDMNNFDPNTRIENYTYSNREQNKSVRENEMKYTLRSEPHGKCTIMRLIKLHFVAENQMYISDYAREAFDDEVLDKPMIVSESAKMQDFDNWRRKGFSIVLMEKVLMQYTHYGAVGASGPVNDPLEMIPNVIYSGGLPGHNYIIDEFLNIISDENGNRLIWE